MAAFSTGERRTRRKGDRRSKELSLVIRQAMESAILLHLLPRTQVSLPILDSTVLCCAVLCSTVLHCTLSSRSATAVLCCLVLHACCMPVASCARMVPGWCQAGARLGPSGGLPRLLCLLGGADGCHCARTPVLCPGTAVCILESLECFLQEIQADKGDCCTAPLMAKCALTSWSLCSFGAADRLLFFSLFVCGADRHLCASAPGRRGDTERVHQRGVAGPGARGRTHARPCGVLLRGLPQ